MCVGRGDVIVSLRRGEQMGSTLITWTRKCVCVGRGRGNVIVSLRRGELTDSTLITWTRKCMYVCVWGEGGGRM